MVAACKYFHLPGPDFGPRAVGQLAGQLVSFRFVSFRALRQIAVCRTFQCSKLSTHFLNCNCNCNCNCSHLIIATMAREKSILMASFPLQQLLLLPLGQKLVSLCLCYLATYFMATTTHIDLSPGTRLGQQKSLHVSCKLG